MGQLIHPFPFYRVMENNIGHDRAVQAFVLLYNSRPQIIHHRMVTFHSRLHQLSGHLVCLDYMKSIILLKDIQDPALSGTHPACYS